MLKQSEIITNNPIIRYSFTGTLEVNSLIFQWKNIIEKVEIYPVSQYFLFDYLNAPLLFNNSQFDEFCKFLNSKKAFIKNGKIAVLTNDPLTTCFFLLVQDEINRIVDCNLKVFCTGNAAIRWINSFRLAESVK